MSRQLRSLKFISDTYCWHSAFTSNLKALSIAFLLVIFSIGSSKAQCLPEVTIDGPSDISVECGTDLNDYGILGYPTIDFNDCGVISVGPIDDVISTDGCTTVISRTWTVTVLDLVLAVSVQTITVVDNEGPVISGVTPEINVQCIDDVPAPDAATAVDACGSASPVQVFTSQTGEMISRCCLSTAYGPGSDWSIWLPLLSSEGCCFNSANWVFDGCGYLDQYADGTAHIHGTVHNASDPAQQFVVSLWLQNKADWATWSGLGRGYRDDLGCATSGQYIDWSYWELVNGFSTLTGAGSLAGDILFLSHSPASYYFGFQAGEGANNRNCNNGLYGSFTYTGTLGGSEICCHHGDLNVDMTNCEEFDDLECLNSTSYSRFYRAIDGCNNETVVEQVINVLDTTAPTFVNCPESVTIQCHEEIPALTEDVQAVDNCAGDVTVQYLGEEEEVESNCYRTITRTWAATDECGNIQPCVQVITIVDTTAPVLSGLPESEEISVECTDIPEAPVVTVSDNCDQEVTVEYTETIEEGDCPSNYTIIRNWTSVDNCQNVASFTQYINVDDTTAPVFDPYQIYIHAECDEEVAALTATDNCGDVEVTLIYECYLAGGCLGMHYRIYEAVDECGNVSTAEHFIAIQDHTAPEFQNVPADENIECSDVSLGEDGNYFDDGGVYAIDNCGYHFYLECLLPIEYTYDEEVVDVEGCPQAFDIVRTWTATDYCGNTATATQTVHVVDTTAPVLTIPADYTANCEDELVFEDASAEDNCGEATITVEQTMIEGNCPNNYTITRTFVAVDECENYSEPQTQTITVVDIAGPVFDESISEFTYECDEVVPTNEPTATDNCSELIEYAYADTNHWTQGCYSGFTRVWTATDECGNSSTLYQYYSIQDTTAPVIAGELEMTRPCDDASGIYVTATDNCNEFEIAIVSDEHVSGSCAGTIIRHYVATDVCGNASDEFVQIIHLTDEVAPVIVSETEDFTVECGAEYGVTAPVFDDNCDEELDITDEVTSSTDGCTTWVIYSWTATDHCDNSVTSSTTVTIEDTTDPYFYNFPGDLTISCEDELPEVVYPEAYDNCDESVDVLYEPTEIPGDCPNERVIYRVFRAFDDCGNQVVETQTITVIDETAPVFGEGNLQEFTYECDEVIPDNQPSATDNCSELIEYAYSDTNSWTQGCFSGFTRIWTATDECGNSSSFYQYYSVQDTTAPVIAGELEIERPCGDSDGIFVTATDNCNEYEIEIVSDEHVSGSCAGTIIRHYVATDVCGNASAEFVQIIHLTDDIAPEANMDPEDMSYECDEEWSAANVTFTDNCDEELDLISSVNLEQDGCTYVYTYTWSATDHCNNVTTVDQVITVTDTTDPVVYNEPVDFTVECGQFWDFTPPTFEDNCDDDLTLDSGSSESTDGCTVTITYWWSATDNCDNTTMVDLVVTIIDTTDPIIVAPNGGEFSCDEDIVYGEASASDTCDEDVELTFEDVTVPGACPQSYSIERTYTAVDDCGNVATTLVIYWVYDNEAPEFTSVPEAVTIECSDALPTDQASAIDNCGEVTITVNDEWYVQGDCYSVIIRTWTAVDECENENTASQTITIIDTTAPVIEGETDVEMPCDNISTEIHASIVATDNCDTDVEIVIWGEDIPVSGSCAGKLIRTYRAYDNCQNWSEFVQFITLIDETAPVANMDPEDMTVECGSEWSPANITFTDNCDDELTLLPDVFVETDGCVTTYNYVWIAIDHCDNATTVNQTITVVDTTDPIIDSEDSEITVDCNIVVDFAVPTATDNCDEDVEVVPSYSSTPGDCPGEYTEVYTFTAIDNCGNSSSVSYTVHHVDNVGPVLENIPSSNEYSCDEVVPVVLPTATDLCSEATVDYEDAIIEGQCPNSYVIVRTFWATDECGNTSEEVSVSYYIYDNEAPTFDNDPADESYECIDWETYVPQSVTATDNCGEASVNPTIVPISSDDCGNGLWQVVYWASDECFNSDSLSYFITIDDVTAPELSEYPSDVVIDCGTELPEAPVVTATDNCTELVEVSYTSTCLSGDCPEVGATPACQLKTPVRPADNPCVYPYDWAMALFAMPNAYKWYQLVENSATMTNNGDGTLTITGQLVNAADPSGGFNFSVIFENELDWAGWSSQSFPTGFKGDCGGIGANHEDWIYYLLQNTDGYELTGWGSYAGSQINLTHAPSNNYFGFQYGVGANNYNAENGFGGWFTYHGTFLVNNEPVFSGMAAGAGDFAFEIDCCIDYDLQRCWTAMDCSGNEVSWCQVISYRDLSEDFNGGDVVDMPVNDDQQIAIVNMAPNPTSNMSQITFASKQDERLSLQVLDMTGRVVADLFNSDVEGGVVYKVDFNANALQAGIYMMRLNSKSESDIERIQIVR